MPIAEQLVREFFQRVWSPPHDLTAIDELMTEDYRITTAGMTIEGREPFKAWVAQMQEQVGEADNEHLEIFTDPSGGRVVSRWITRGVNQGILGAPVDRRPIEFTGIAIWHLRGERLAECWVERAAWELHQRLTSKE